MVLYSVVTTYHLIEALVHKLRFNKEKNGVLLVSQWLVDKYPWYMEVECIFDEVVVFDAQYRYSSNIVKDLNSYYSKLFASVRIKLNEMEEIHVFGAEHSFGSYIFANQISNCYWEEGAGALSKKNSMFEIFEKTHGKEKAKFQYEMHLGDGEAPFVEKRFYNKYFQLNEVMGENLVHFDLEEELRLLSENDRNMIVNLFWRTDKIKVEDDSALLLTEHFANLSIMTWEEQLYLYKYLVDYFLGGYKLLIKTHPDDNMYYELLFENCNSIRTKFPAELLSYIFEGQPAVVATSSSTSIYGLRKSYDKVLEFNFKFSHERQFYSLNRYYVALSYADKLVKKGWHLNLLGVNSVIVDNFSRFLSVCTQEYTDYGTSIENLREVVNGKNVWIVDEIEQAHLNAKNVCEWIKGLSENDVVFFLNSDEGYCFYDYDSKHLWKSMGVIEVRTKALDGVDNSVTIAGPQVNEDRYDKVFVYQRGEFVEVYNLKKELPNVGVSVEAQGFEGDKYQVKILEGMLEATEKRLLYYIEREKELLKKMEEE